MAYITSRKDRFYVVAYDGHDPLTGRERRKWHPAGRSRADAEAIMATLNDTKTVQTAELAKPTTLAAFLTDIWLPCRRGQLQPTTARRYAWIVENYIKPRIGYLALRNVRTEHLDALYLELLKCGGQDGDALAPKTVYDVHVVVRSGLGDAVRRHYLTNNVATSARPPRPQARARSGPDSWTTDQLRRYLDSVRQLRLSPAIHLAATTGMRRGEVAGLRWGDWQPRTRRLSIARARQVVGGRSMEVPCKTRSSRRCVDLDKRTDAVLAAWRQRQQRDGHPTDCDDPIFTNTSGQPLHPESLTQLFIVTSPAPACRESGSTIMPTFALCRCRSSRPEYDLGQT